MVNLIIVEVGYNEQKTLIITTNLLTGGAPGPPGGAAKPGECPYILPPTLVVRE